MVELTRERATMSFNARGVSSETAKNSHFELQSHISGRRQTSCKVHNDVNQGFGCLWLRPSLSLSRAFNSSMKVSAAAEVSPSRSEIAVLLVSFTKEFRRKLKLKYRT